METSSRAVGERSRIVAVLGPTNTGKTYLAMERMLGHESGIIGFPLRLLARENYERAVAIKGRRQVALITGEEKIVPAEARYFLCTVEAMPVSRQVAFVGIDEIQMCADPDRGHIFTDRLLHARGTRETMVMGAETIRALLRRLIPEAEFITRPRFSALNYNGPRKITRLPGKSAIVTFSVADVYAIAELIRRQRGGAAVVLGALSPRTRNAQVEMYQAGEVAYLVATDAIGMGLNMNIDHVALAALRKFDGRVPRALSAAELAQIAGRAGRYMKDGTFGTTAEVDGLDAELAEQIEASSFPSLRALFWRNADLSFASIRALRASLARPSGRPDLVRAREADDEVALAALARDHDIAAHARGADAVGMLWDVCRVPDFGKVMSDGHARLLGRIFRFLAGIDGHGDGCLPTDWVARQVDRINRADGDIDTLMQRIANIRTWTYIAYQGWLADAGHWQERTRAIEDKLSDVLHQRLIARFVDRRTAVLVSHMRERRALTAAVNARDEVHVEGHFVGNMNGFQFVADDSVDVAAGDARRVVTAAAEQALRAEMALRVRALEGEDDGAFALGADAAVRWRGGFVARLVAGATILRPRIEPQADGLVDAALRERVSRRLVGWLDAHLRANLQPLFAASEILASGAARGLLYQLRENLGAIARKDAAAQLAALSDRDKATLRAHGLVLGRQSIFFRSILRPAPAGLRALLWAVHAGVAPPPGLDFARTSLLLEKRVPVGLYAAAGFFPVGPRAVRADILERIAGQAHGAARGGAARVPPTMSALLGCGGEDVVGVLRALGFSVEDGGDGPMLSRPKATRRARTRSSPAAHRKNETSPFAILRGHVSRR
ncbi:MAG: disulfide oxidoreductase [Rhodospirillales bacterium]|nr:disulfide oxidoreductase [Rhodospirillales bacterium]